MGAPPIGPKTFFICSRSGDAWPHEVREVLKLGIGGGTPIDQVPGLLRRYFDERPFQGIGAVRAGHFRRRLGGPFEDPVGKNFGGGGHDDEPLAFSAPLRHRLPSDSIPERSIELRSVRFAASVDGFNVGPMAATMRPNR